MIYFVIPMYNEAANLPALLRSLAQWSREWREDCHLIAVDDGSGDETPEILDSFEDFPVTVVRHDPNLGVAAAFRSGFAAWTDFPFEADDLVVTLEADNTSSLAILRTMVDRARSNSDLVLASCYAPGGAIVGTNLIRTFLSFCANLILRSTPKMPNVCTFSSFYRVHRATLLRRAIESYGERLIEEVGFVCVVELLWKFGRVGARISEVPLRLDGSVRIGASKMKVMRTVFGYLDLFMRAATKQIASPAEGADSGLRAERARAFRLALQSTNRRDPAPVAECLERSASDSIGS
jgi:dolichol-phosphate mannosyltransferase